MSKIKKVSKEEKAREKSNEIERELDKTAEHIVRNEVHLVQSALVEECLAKDIFSYDDVKNYYVYKNKNTGDTYSDSQRDTEIERLKSELEEAQGELEKEKNNSTMSNVSALENDIKDLEEADNEAQEIFEWWAVSKNLADDLEEEGEAILDNDY